MANLLDNSSGDVVELSSTDGVAFIEQASLLTRLHYFDGQFLRATSLTTEQDYHRHAIQLANLAGGWGVVNGFGIALAGEQLQVGAGLAITPTGHFVLAGMDMRAKLADLLGSAQPAAVPGSSAFDHCLETKAQPAATATTGLHVYEITVGPIEGLCGNEAVFGKLCETACATDSRRPYWREGVVLRLRPLNLALPESASIPATTAHLRNRIASAYFAREPGQPGPLLSAAGLASPVWCQPATHYSRDEVVIGLLWRDANVARIDAWSGRRERMDTQPRAYWQGRMAMRPWNVFTAQILQFQCQLSGLFDANTPVLQPEDDCERVRTALGDARKEIEALLKRFQDGSKGLAFKSGERESFKRLQDASSAFKSSYADLAGLSNKLAGLDVGQGAQPQQRMLLNAGFLELPPAGYLPAKVGSDVGEQCRRMFGEGVALHFHAVRHDEIAHLVEEAEHLDRISLTRGLDDPAQVEAVEVFVPEGQVSRATDKPAGTWWNIRMDTRALVMLALARVRQQPPDTQAPPAAPAPAPQEMAASPKSQPTPTAMANDASAQPDTTEILRQRIGLAQLQRLATNRFVLDGLIRTEARADGSFGFALIVGADLSQAMKEATGQDIVAQWLAYLSGDALRDPFDLPIGGSTTLRAELDGLMLRTGIALRIEGQLTVLRQRTQADGTQERLVQFDFLTVERGTESGQTTDTQIPGGRIRFVLQRDGDGRTGIFVIDDERQDPSSSPLFFDWSDAPQRASLSVEAAKADTAIQKRAEALRGLGGLSSNLAAGTENKADTATGTVAADRTRLMEMAALPDMPAPASEQGAEVLNRLAAIAETIDDGAFLLRARQRLLPTLDAPKVETISAKADWVMFRRARPHLCGPACANAPAPLAETFQVWHARLESEAELAALKKALDAGDSGGLAKFKFSRVGLLRYRDESTYAEESAAQVLQMWQLAAPGALVALGRIWEIAPATGQGWQNHMRLRHMLEQIDSLTKAPPAGDGSLAAIAPPPGELSDRAMNGGMLVVTIGVSARHALMVYSGYDTPNHFFDKDAPHAPLDFLGDVPQGDALGSFIDSLTANQPVRGVTLATTKADPDSPHAQARLATVIAALAARGIAIPVARQHVVRLNNNDRDQLSSKLGVAADSFDEITFFEQNAGPT